MIIEENFGASGFTTLDGFGYVELQEITSSQFLDPNVTYYVPDPPLLIHGVGEVIDVIIPSGTTIILAEDWDYGIVVYDGANVYFGEPAPQYDEPNDIYEPNDANNPVPPVWIVGESGSSFFNNFCGIFIDRTAGIRCKLDNICLRGFYYGLVVDQQLDYPISNIHVLGCYNGILSFGPNRILNSTVSYYGMWSAEWQYYGLAYCFQPESWDGNIIFEGADFEIYNCLADDGDDGFTVYGLYEPNEPPNFYSRDCVATNCYSGFNGWNGIIAFSIICPGLYNNYQNKNFPEMPFTDPVYEVNDPLVVDSNDYRFFLNPDSNFVDHGSGLSPYPGWTTCIDGIPDEGVGDIWPHYQTKQVELLSADLNSDHSVDMNDLAEFVGQWLVPGPNSADLNNDQIANFIDFSVFTNQWQNTEMYIELIDVAQYSTIEPNNVSGYVGIRLKNIPVSGEMVTVYIDNMQIGCWLSGLSDRDRLICFESDSFSNGWHIIRLASMDIYGQVVNHKPINVYFNNLLYKVSASDYFHPVEDYEFRGFYDGNDTLEAEVTNWDGQLIWSDTYSGPHVNIVIPGATFNNRHICELTVEESTGMMLNGGTATESDSKKYKKKICKKFVKEDFSGVKMVLLLPNPDLVDAKFSLICTIMNSCESKGVPYGCIYYHDNTPENWTYVFHTLVGAKDIYYGGHANSHIGSVQRTNLVTYRKYPYSDWFLPPIGWGVDPISKYYEVPALSYTTHSVPDAEELPNNLDDCGFDLRDLDLKDDDKIRIGWFDGCRTAGYESGEEGEDRICCLDLAETFGFLSDKAAGNKRSIFFGWRMITENRPGLPDIFTFVNAGQKIVWETLGEGRTIQQALERTDVSNIYIKQALWGEDMQRDFVAAGDDNLFAYGFGLLWDMKLKDVLE